MGLAEVEAMANGRVNGTRGRRERGRKGGQGKQRGE
jgi:hypothetical protein